MLRTDDLNQLIVGPVSWAYQVLRQTFGERFMPNSEVSIFIDRSYSLDFRSSRRNDLFQPVILFGTARVIALSTRVVKTVFFFAFVSDVKIITK